MDDLLLIYQELAARATKQLERAVKVAQEKQKEMECFREALYDTRDSLTREIWRLQQEARDTSKAEVDQIIIKRLSAKNDSLEQENTRLRNANAHMSKKIRAIGPDNRPRVNARGTEETIYIARSVKRLPLTREEIFQKVWAEASTVIAESEQELDSIRAVFEFAPDLPFTQDLGRAQKGKRQFRSFDPETMVSFH